MSYKSLVTLNPQVIGKPKACLKYACDLSGVPHGVDYAWQSWEMAANKHADQNFPGVPVPCFFSYTLNHVNEGHVVWHVPNVGFYSEPYTTRKGAQYQDANGTHALLPSIAEVERIYGVKFVGWAEQLNGHRVCQAVADPAPTPSPPPAPAPAPAAPTQKYLNFPTGQHSFWTYNVGGPYDQEHHAHVLTKAAGISYPIVQDLGNGLVVIPTKMYGHQAVYAADPLTVTEAPQFATA